VRRAWAPSARPAFQCGSTSSTVHPSGQKKNDGICSALQADVSLGGFGWAPGTDRQSAVPLVNVLLRQFDSAHAPGGVDGLGASASVAIPASPVNTCTAGLEHAQQSASNRA